MKAIELARSIQHAANDLEAYDASKQLRQEDLKDIRPAETAKTIRKILGLSTIGQLKSPDARLFYSDVRKAIEQHQIFVIQQSFPKEDGAGFCISNSDGYDVIVINTYQQSYERRLFTLAHELCHVLLGQSGISDPNIMSNAIERRCNKFAAMFIAPDEVVEAAAKISITKSDFDISELRQFSQLTKLSLHASLLRLIEADRYQESAHGAWQSYISANGDPDYKKAGGGGRRADEWKYKLSKYGFAFASVFGGAKRAGDLDDIEIYRIAGIKPKWQDSYFENASSARAEDVEDA
ncbi:ImmA/IrrE family metallo-endopeptidase [Microvirga sp. BT689]|uniref:ImmA/IrrE family metallo-endopeptidase n=1 Tax=Microvirga arvi TaxID=2778731 RepID=UPI0019504547|nr:ImmA/IrrE family metallo-endopeptidase [Microvirga arvi]MBM6582319.1 ImmA/IrrE family metallo-endopeptidase [Microvirga arvi]